MIHTRDITLGCVSLARRTKAFSKKEDTSPHYTIPMVIVIVHPKIKNINTQFKFFSFFCKNYIIFLVDLCKVTRINFVISTNFLTVCYFLNISSIIYKFFTFFGVFNQHFIIFCLLKLKITIYRG